MRKAGWDKKPDKRVTTQQRLRHLVFLALEVVAEEYHDDHKEGVKAVWRDLLEMVCNEDTDSVVAKKVKTEFIKFSAAA